MATVRPESPGAEPGTASWPAGESLWLSDTPETVRVGRRFAEGRARALGAEDLADAVAQISAELLANAYQHGSAPVGVRVVGGPESVLVEVYDASPRPVVRGVADGGSMTGRGLALVEKLSTRWGVRPQNGGGKTVWAELEPGALKEFGSPADGELDADALLEAWEDLLAGDEITRYTVHLGEVPTDLLVEAKSHIDNLVREFTLASSGERPVPAHLANLIETVVHGFADARSEIKRQALAAARRGEPRTVVTLHLPVSAAQAGAAYLAALDEADEYSRAARLLTLETPPEHRLFRRWYVHTVIEQLGAFSRGETPPPVERFDKAMIREIRRLAVARRAGERAVRLQGVTAALARSRTPGDVARVVVSEGVQVLGASGGSLLVPAGDGRHLAVPGAVGYGAELVGALREERADAPLPAATAMRTGQPIWIESLADRDRKFPALRGFEPASVAMCAVPLEVAGEVIGALRFSFDNRRLFDEEERGFVLALAAQTAQTLRRTELYQVERRAALQLQRALLPRVIAEAPGWDIAAHYSPAGDEEVGGDWFDVIPLPDGRVATIVGDVMGRGLEAAAAMAQIRATMRAYVLDDPDPGLVSRRMDSFFDSLALTQFVTVLYFLGDAGTGIVQVVNAGHLPPLFAQPGRATEALPGAVGLPLGAGPDDRSVLDVYLPSGAIIVAITDGLVERRGEDIDAGIARVVDRLKVIEGEPAETVLDSIVSGAAEVGLHEDDVTVLVMRRLPD